MAAQSHYKTGALVRLLVDEGAVILGDTRYEDALVAVERAQREHDEFRDNLELQRELGMEGFVKGLRVRKEAVQLARRELARIRPPASRKRPGRRSARGGCGGSPRNASWPRASAPRVPCCRTSLFRDNQSRLRSADRMKAPDA